MENKNQIKLIKFLRAIFITVIFICLVVTIGARIYFRSSLRTYYKDSHRAFLIPDLNDGFVPQGICYDGRMDALFIAGYSVNGASPIYVVDRDGNVLRKVSLANVDGSDFVNHAGGITIHNDYVYLAGCDDKCLYVLSYDDICESQIDDTVECLGSIVFDMGEDDYLRADCLTVDENGIYVTEFYREENYHTAASHENSTIGGDVNYAYAVKFLFDDSANGKYGINMEPVLAISIPDLVQGICIEDGKAYLSRSYGAAASTIDVYNIKKADKGKKTTVLGQEVPFWEFDNLSLFSQKKIPPMSEEIVCVDGYIYTMCESASNKYIFGKFTSSEYCYATPLEFFKKK